MVLHCVLNYLLLNLSRIIKINQEAWMKNRVLDKKKIAPFSRDDFYNFDDLKSQTECPDD